MNLIGSKNKIKKLKIELKIVIYLYNTAKFKN